MTAIEVLATGWLTTLQDRGRYGYGSLGVPAAGAIDQSLAALVNRLVGNPDDTVVIETTTGFEIQALGKLTLASSLGAEVFTLGPGERYRLASDGGRNFAYLAVRGGLEVEPVLGSRSQDTLTGTGPIPLRPGRVLRIGDDPGTPIHTDSAPVRPLPSVIRLWPGPHLDSFDDSAVAALIETPWCSTASFNRVAMRLDGPALVRRNALDIQSLGLIPGALQVPPDKQPVMMLRDHPVTGGYPVIAVVDDEDVHAVAQCQPGSPFRFVWADGSGR